MRKMVHFAMLQTDNQILLTDPGQDAFYHASDRSPSLLK